MITLDHTKLLGFKFAVAAATAKVGLKPGRSTMGAKVGWKPVR